MLFYYFCKRLEDIWSTLKTSTTLKLLSIMLICLLGDLYLSRVLIKFRYRVSLLHFIPQIIIICKVIILLFTLVVKIHE